MQGSIVKDPDLVHVPESFVSMGDEKHAAASHEPVEGLHDCPGGGAIQPLGGLVEDQDRGVLEQCPGDGQAAGLTAGECDPRLPDLGLVALRLGRDEPMDIDRSAGLLQPLLGGGGVGVRFRPGSDPRVWGLHGCNKSATASAIYLFAPGAATAATLPTLFRRPAEDGPLTHAEPRCHFAQQ